MLTRRRMILAPLAAALLHTPAVARTRTQATLYKTPDCGCCEGYAQYLRRNGFDVQTIATHDLPLIRKQHDIPEALEGCHTTLVDGYVVEGHVPIDSVRKLLDERPGIKGISLPGMPDGSPGMTGTKAGPFTIYAIATPPTVFARE